jgi:protein-tyrosine phosphatase
VTATAERYEITEAGLVPADEVEKLAARILLFVCTGNTCRSPLAEGLAKSMLAERLGCSVDELPRRGIWVLSAGVSAYSEAPAATEAVEVAAELGADLRGHRSRSVSAALLAAADDVIAMTRGHAQALAARFPDAGPNPRLLCGDTDLDDPIGAGLEVYRHCARMIRSHLERFIPEWTGT